MPTSTPLVFDGGYRVGMCYETADGKVGEAKAGIWASGQSGLLWFFDRGNAEALVKVLNGCAHNGRRWIYVAPVTDVAFNLHVTSSGGRRWTHRNRLGETASTRSDTSAFVCADDDAPSTSAGTAPGLAGPETVTARAVAGSSLSRGEYTDCRPTTAPLVFAGGYRVSMCYETADGKVGEAKAGIWASGQSGLLWFFDRGNAEALVKVLNGCAHNGRRWIYVAPVTDLAFNLHVTSSGGRRWTHRNRLGETAVTASDTSAFDCAVDDAPNRWPVISNQVGYQYPRVGDPAVVVDLANHFSDPDGDPLTFRADSNNRNVVTASVEGSRLLLTGIAEGSSSVNAFAEDPGGLYRRMLIGVIVKPGNRPPVVSNPTDSLTLAPGGPAVDIAGWFSDPDGDPLTFSANSSNANAVTAVAEGSRILLTPVAEGSAVVSATATDPDGLSASLTVNVTVEVPPPENRRPVISNQVPDQWLTLGEPAVEIDLAKAFSDPDGDPLTFSANAINRSVLTTSIDGSRLFLIPVAEGGSSVNVWARDPDGLFARMLIRARVERPNRPPVVLRQLPDVTLTAGGPEHILDITGVFSDPEGLPMTRSVASSNTNVVTAVNVIGSGPQIRLTPVAQGSAVVTVTATDQRGASASTTFNVTVNAGG